MLQGRFPPRRPLPALALLLGLTLAETARAEPAWGPDKAKHLAISLGLGAGCYTGLRLLGRDPPALQLAFSVGLALMPGLLKEIYDAGQPGRSFSGLDLAWDTLGAASGALIAFGFDWLVGRLTRQRRGAPTAAGPSGRNQLVELLPHGDNGRGLSPPGSRPP